MLDSDEVSRKIPLIEYRHENKRKEKFREEMDREETDKASRDNTEFVRTATKNRTLNSCASGESDTGNTQRLVSPTCTHMNEID